MEAPAILLEAVTKTYRLGEVPVPALRGVDLRLEEGEFTALVGPSGSGKTTLLNLVGCLERPTTGRVVIQGDNTAALSSGALADLRRDRMGFIFQYFNLIPVLTAYENVELPLLLAGRRQRPMRVWDLLRAVGLEDKARHRPTQLSGGEQQRVSVARALALEPLIVLADEPTGNLDSTTAQGVLDLMRRINDERGVTFLFSTHDPLIIVRARRRVYLADGRIVREERESLQRA
ncbi:MAG: ABC transporter ATP-binding protein [Chloroflexi bacterium]|nr:ABC transporter ATP-binding protein [Chloroflexota bacterium]